MKFTMLFSAFGIILLASCRTQYQPVNIFGNEISDDTQPSNSALNTAADSAAIQYDETESTQAYAGNFILPEELNYINEPIYNTTVSAVDSCVQLVWKKGDSVQVDFVTIVENNTKSITYMRCDEYNTTTYSVDKTNVLNIVGIDGTITTVVPSNYTLKTNPSSAASLIFGILSVFPFYTSIFFGALGIICSIRARRQIKKGPEQKGVNLAKTGMILSIVGMALFTLLFTLVALAFGI